MIRYFKHKKRNLFLREFSGIVTEADILKFFEYENYCFNTINEKLVIVTIFVQTYDFQDKELLNIIAEHSATYQSRFQISILVGITGIKRVLYNVFSLISVKSFPRELIDDVLTFETKYNLKFPNDFYEIKE